MRASEPADNTADGRRLRRSDGATLVEYVILAALIAVIATVAVNALVEDIGEATEKHQQSVLEVPGGDASGGPGTTKAPTTAQATPTTSDPQHTPPSPPVTV